MIFQGAMLRSSGISSLFIRYVSELCPNLVRILSEETSEKHRRKFEQSLN